MTDMNPNQIVVVTEEKKRRKGFMWIAAGTAALLLGGSTFALWSANDTIAGGTITAGDLDIAASESVSFWDVSHDRKDIEQIPTTNGSQPGHAIDDIDAWKVVPGDKVAASFETTATLEGDNLVGQLTLDGLEDYDSTISTMNYSYEVYNEGELIVSETALPEDPNTSLLYLSAPGTGQESGLEDATIMLGTGAPAIDGVTAQNTVFGMPETTGDFTVVIYASFFDDKDGDFKFDQDVDGSSEERIDVSGSDVLADLKLTLSQVRDTGEQFN